jgi:2-amino-4-hydroxy-6-hydroxymethyldihydropteridine diphosphokinase
MHVFRVPAGAAIVIALGSNLPGKPGKPPAVLRAALRALARAGVRVRRCSSFYLSAAVPASAQPRFVNAVALVETVLGPAALLRLLHDIERQFGRMRRQRNAARILDLDLIDYRGWIAGGGSGLPILPHPRAFSRGFVLLPLAEIAPGIGRPGGRRIGALPLGPEGRPVALNRPLRNACLNAGEPLHYLFRPRPGSPLHGPRDRGRLC